MNETIDFIKLDKDKGTGELRLNIRLKVDVKVIDRKVNKTVYKEINVSIKAMNREFKSKAILNNIITETEEISDVAYYLIHNKDTLNNIEKEIIKYGNIKSLLPYYKEIEYILDYGIFVYAYRSVLEYKDHKEYIDMLEEQEYMEEQLKNF